jgi:tetratricopeptide (TPR) repeat protein
MSLLVQDGPISRPSNGQHLTCDTALLLASADSLLRQYETDWDQATLNESIALLLSAQQLLSPTTTSVSSDYLSQDALSSCLIKLAWAYDSRYRHTGNAKDLQEQIACCDAILVMPSTEGHHDNAILLLGAALRTRHRSTGDAGDIERAVRLHRTLVDKQETPSARLASELGRTLWARYLVGSDMLDFEEARKMHEHALVTHSTSNHDLAVYQQYLANVLRARFSMFGVMDDLERSIQLLSESLTIRTAGHRDRNVSLTELAICYAQLYETAGNLDHRNRSIQLFEEALVLQGDQHPHYALTLTTLAHVLLVDNPHTGSLQDLERVVQLLRSSLQFHPIGHPSRHYTLESLAGALKARFEFLGNVDDEDEAIALRREVFLLRSPSHEARGFAMGSLANELAERYRRIGNPSDAAESMQLYKELRQLYGSTRSGPFYVDVCFSYAELLLARHHFTGSRADLDDAISLYHDWLDHGSKDSFKKDVILHDAADALMCRFRISQDYNDLTSAIEKLESALHLRPVGHPRRYASLHDLASALQYRYIVTRDTRDLEAAVELQNMALSCLVAGHPGRARVLCGLSRVYASSDSPYHDISLALDYSMNALEDNTCGAYSRVEEFLEVLPHIEPVALNERANIRLRMFEVFRSVLHLLPQIVDYGLDLRERLRILKSTEHLAVLGAKAALRSGKIYDAVEVLEAGRVVFWSHHLRLRTDFDTLPAELSKELLGLARQLEQGTQHFAEQSQEDLENNRTIVDAALVANRKLGYRFDALIDKARKLPGFERFLLHKPYSVLSRAAERCSVVVLIADNDSCDAILIRGPEAQPERVMLPGVTSNGLRILSKATQDAKRDGRTTREGRAMRRVKPKGAGISDTLRSLWEQVVQPIVNVMDVSVRSFTAYMLLTCLPPPTQKSTGSTRARILICPTGVFSLVPIHAASTTTGGQFVGLTDYLVPSYTPTLGAILNARSRYTPIPRSEARVLLACVPNPFKWKPLPFATQEAADIRDILPTTSVLSILDDGDVGATVTDVQEHLPKASILHLACHGYQDPDMPLNSGFVMRDNMLTVSHLMRLSLPHALLAILSACETAKGDLQQPDQAVHLAAAMLFSGFKSIVATMWYVLHWVSRTRLH